MSEPFSSDSNSRSLKSSESIKNPLERHLTISLPSEAIEEGIKKRLDALAKTARIDGFRPGKVPEAVLKKRYRSSIEHEILGQTAEAHFTEALRKDQLLPVGTPVFEPEGPYQAGKPFVFKVTFEVFPEIPACAFETLIIEKPVASVTEDDITQTLEGMRKQQVSWQDVSEKTIPAKEGDRVWLRFEGFVDGQPFEGSQAENMSLILGSKTTIEGFEKGLLGAHAGQDLVLNVVFPESYGVPHLASKAAQFNVHVNHIQQPVYPALNDAFANQFGVSEGGLAALQEKIKATLAHQLTHAIKNKTKQNVMQKLYEAYQHLDIPQHLLKKEIEQMALKAKKQLPAGIPEPEETLFKTFAHKNIVLSLVIHELIDRAHFHPRTQNVQALAARMAESFDVPEKALEALYKNKKTLTQLEDMDREDQLVESILAQATVVEVPSTAHALLSLHHPH